VKTSVIMAFTVNISQLLIKYRWNGSVCEDVGDCGVSSKYFQLSIKYRWKHSIWTSVGDVLKKLFRINNIKLYKLIVKKPIMQIKLY